LPRSFPIMIRPCQPIQASGLVGPDVAASRQRRASAALRSALGLWQRIARRGGFQLTVGVDGVRRDGKRNNSRGRRGCDRSRRANNCQNLHRKPSRGHDELPSGRRANGSSRLFPGVSELGTAAVATQSFHCRRSALLADCWHSCTHLHAYRDARGFVDRDLRVQGSTCRLKIRNAPNAL
jgi:hypothetical protein